jgi:hypothetical protein
MKETEKRSVCRKSEPQIALGVDMGVELLGHDLKAHRSPGYH